MATFEVPIIRVDKVIDHPNADRLSLNYFREYVTVSAKLEDGSHRYKAGDYVIYVPEGAVIPEFLLRRGFWNEEKNKGMLAGSNGDRVKGIKLRQILSQGIMFSVDYFDGFDPEQHFVLKHFHPEFEVEEGKDVAELLGVVKYEPPIPATMAGEVASIGSENTVKFDVENIKRHPHIIQNGDEVIVLEKLHGTCAAFMFNPNVSNDQLWDNHSYCYSKGLGASGLVFKNNEKNVVSNIYVRTMNKIYDKELFESLFDGKKFAIYGEISGRGVQDLHYGFNEPTLTIFDVWVDGEWQDWDTVVKVAEKIGVSTVPVLYRGSFSKEIRQLKDGASTLFGHVREGIVIKHIEPKYSDEIGRIILKDISEAYLLRKNGSEFT
jgi:RNA ligase (TIGR02306 family)